MTTISQSINNQKVSIRWREPYVTEGINKKVLPLPRGVYRGFWFNDQSPPTDRLVLSIEPLTPIGLDLRSVVVIEDQASGYSVTITEDELAGVAVDVSTFLGDPAEVILYVWIEAEYTTGAETTASYYVSDSALAVPTDGAIFLGALTVPAAAVVIDMNVCTADYTDRDTPQAKKVESADDYVAGDLQYGMMSGVDRYTLITPNQKDAIEASVLPSAANEMVTQSVLDGVDAALSAGIVANTAAIVENDGEIADIEETIEDLEQSTLPPDVTKSQIATKLFPATGVGAGWAHMWSSRNSLVSPGAIPINSQLLDIAVAFVGTDEETRILVIDKFYNAIYGFDPVTQAYQTFNFEATETPTAMCSDGTNIYVLIRNDTLPAGSETHALRCLTISETGFENRAGWTLGGVVLSGVGVRDITEAFYDDYSDRVVIANDEYVAVAASWISPSADTDPVIQMVRRDSPVYDGGGAGDNNANGDGACGGGMASDGNYIVFGAVDPGEYGGICSVDITNVPTSMQTGTGIPFAGWPEYDTSDNFINDIAFDGTYFYFPWYGNYGIWICDAVTDPGSYPYLDRFDEAGTPAAATTTAVCSDGMDVWFHSYADDTSPNNFCMVWNIGVGGFTSGLEAATRTYDQLYKSLHITDSVAGAQGDQGEHMGRMVFDGQDIWVIPDRRTGETLSGLIRRVPRARNRG